MERERGLNIFRCLRGLVTCNFPRDIVTHKQLLDRGSEFPQSMVRSVVEYICSYLRTAKRWEWGPNLETATQFLISPLGCQRYAQI